MRKSGLFIVIPLIPVLPFYIAYALAKQAINPEIDTLKLVVSIRILSTRTRLYRARLSGLADSQQLEKWHASTTKLSEDLGEWERQRTGSSIIKRRKFRKELRSLEKRISEHDKDIEAALQEARRQRVEIALRRKPSTILLGLVNDEI